MARPRGAAATKKTVAGGEAQLDAQAEAQATAKASELAIEEAAAKNKATAEADKSNEKVLVQAKELGYYGDRLRQPGKRFYVPGNAVPAWAKVVKVRPVVEDEYED